MTSLTFFGGIREIGGNKILLETKETKIFLDFGESFGLLDKYFVDWLQPRDRFGLRDLFALDLMPKLKGLYSKEALAPTTIKHSSPTYDAIFITHPHIDHVLHLQYVDQRIPIYIGETAKTILESSMQTASSFFFSTTDMKKRDGSIIPANVVRTFRTNDKITIGDITLTPIHVDHSVPGAYGFIVETPESTIAYSGDLRKHGNKPELTQHFMDAVEKSAPDAFIIEGTRVAPKESRKNHTELFVREESEHIAKESKKLILAMRYPKDLDRFRTFYQIAKETGRKLVISLKTAHMLLALNEDKGLSLPNPLKDESIAVYCREKKVYFEWETPLIRHCVNSDYVKEHQKDIIWELDFLHLAELVDVAPEKEGVCIHSMSEPFEEDPSSQLQDQVLHNWLERFSMEHHQLHASGHASHKEIMDMVRQSGAKTIFPIHTQYPEMFKESGMKIALVEKGEKREI